MWKRVFLVGLILIFLSGCSMQTNQTEKLQDLEYTIVEEADLPEELRTILEEKKKESFKLTYEAEDSLYLSENAIYFDTNLIGPEPSEPAAEAVSYPYLAVKTAYLDKPVVFQ